MSDFRLLGSIGTRLATTAATAVYVVPLQTIQTQFANIHIANVDPVNSVDITLEWYSKVANVSFTLLPALRIASKTGFSHKFELAMLPEDELRVTASAANDLHVVVTGAEFSR